jgi:hypothetical protein
MGCLKGHVLHGLCDKVGVRVCVCRASCYQLRDHNDPSDLEHALPAFFGGSPVSSGTCRAGLCATLTHLGGFRLHLCEARPTEVTYARPQYGVEMQTSFQTTAGATRGRVTSSRGGLSSESPKTFYWLHPGRPRGESTRLLNHLGLRADPVRLGLFFMLMLRS